VLRPTASFSAPVILCGFHLLTLGDGDTVADGSGERIDSSICALVEEDRKERLQDQSDYFEREGPVNCRFPDNRYELNDEVGDTKNHGEDLDDGRFNDEIHKDCVPGCRYDTTGYSVGARSTGGFLCKICTADEIPEKLGEETTPEASPDDID